MTEIEKIVKGYSGRRLYTGEIVEVKGVLELSLRLDVSKKRKTDNWNLIMEKGIPCRPRAIFYNTDDYEESAEIVKQALSSAKGKKVKLEGKVSGLVAGPDPWIYNIILTYFNSCGFCSRGFEISFDTQGKYEIKNKRDLFGGRLDFSTFYTGAKDFLLRNIPFYTKPPKQ